MLIHMTLDPNEHESAEPTLTVEDFAVEYLSQLDPVDRIRGLAHLDVLLECVQRARNGRLRVSRGSARSAAERHLAEYGHEFNYGCCRVGPDDEVPPLEAA